MRAIEEAGGGRVSILDVRCPSRHRCGARLGGLGELVDGFDRAVAAAGACSRCISARKATLRVRQR